MAPVRLQPKSRSRGSRSESSVGLDHFPTPPRMVPTKSGRTPSRTPIRSPRKHFRVTLAQKQALVENLRLEITERARKLRAQYALRTQGLRSRLEMRIHRIPVALRGVTIADLLQKQLQKEKQTAAQSQKGESQEPTHSTRQLPLQKAPTKIYEDPLPRTGKRTSTQLDNDNTGQENAGTEDARKRVCTGNGAGQSKASGSRPDTKRAPASREVLSPKSNNSRTLPASPFKGPGLSPHKSNIARPVSPLKPSATKAVAPTAASRAKSAPRSKGMTTTTTSRATSRQGQAGPTGPANRGRRGKDEHAATIENTTGRSSDASDRTNTSAGTTIVRRGPAKKNLTTKATSSAAKKTTGTVKKLVAGLESKKEAAASRGRQPATGTVRSTQGGRTLRKRT